MATKYQLQRALEQIKRQIDDVGNSGLEAVDIKDVLLTLICLIDRNAVAYDDDKYPTWETLKCHWTFVKKTVDEYIASND